MTFKQLQYVVETSKAGSISKAARLLFLTQSNLSSTIQSLEKELGVNLFVRGSDGISLTAEGEVFIVHAQIILDSYNGLMQLGKANRSERFAIGVSSISFFSDAFAKFCNKYQTRDIRMTIQIYNDVDAAINLLRTGQIDLEVAAIISSYKYHIYEMCDQNKIKRDLLGTLPINVQMRKGHPLLERYDPEMDFNFNAMFEYPYVDYIRNQGNLRAATILDTYNVLPINPNNTILVADSIQKDRVICSTNAYAIGAERSPNRQNSEIININLPRCFFEIDILTSRLYPANRLIPDYRSFLINDLLLCPEFKLPNDDA